MVSSRLEGRLGGASMPHPKALGLLGCYVLVQSQCPKSEVRIWCMPAACTALKTLPKMTIFLGIMFKKIALILTAVTSLAIANANAGSPIVVSSNGYFGAASGAFLNAQTAIARATEVCQKKGGTDIKVLASRSCEAQI